jgi:hypothetical protein
MCDTQVFPNDILYNIFQFLPQNDRARSASVNYFTHSHFGGLSVEDIESFEKFLYSEANTSKDALCEFVYSLAGVQSFTPNGIDAMIIHAGAITDFLFDPCVKTLSCQVSRFIRYAKQLRQLRVVGKTNRLPIKFFRRMCPDLHTVLVDNTADTKQFPHVKRGVLLSYSSSYTLKKNKKWYVFDPNYGFDSNSYLKLRDVAKDISRSIFPEISQADLYSLVDQLDDYSPCSTASDIDSYSDSESLYGPIDVRVKPVDDCGDAEEEDATENDLNDYSDDEFDDEETDDNFLARIEIDSDTDESKKKTPLTDAEMRQKLKEVIPKTLCFSFWHDQWEKLVLFMPSCVPLIVEQLRREDCICASL